MRKEIQTATLPSGGHLLFLVLSALAVGVACIVNFSIRWVLWCNMSEQPFAQASFHTALVVLTVFCVALVASNMIRPRDLWRVEALCGVFFLGIPTLMFFRDYLVANFLVVLSMYNVMRIQDHPGEEKAKVFFASFFVVLAGWFVPAAVAFVAVVYVGVLVFSPSDIRTWLLPLAGVAASYILLVTYEVVWLGGDSFFPELSSRLFAMPYAEKVFKADGFYFYLVCLLLAWGWAYAKYWRFAWGETIPRKKRFFVISAMGLTAFVIAALLLRYKYLVVFFAVPFSVVIARFFAVATASQRTAMRWYLTVAAGLGLLFFK